MMSLRCLSFLALLLLAATPLRADDWPALAEADLFASSDGIYVGELRDLNAKPDKDGWRPGVIAIDRELYNAQPGTPQVTTVWYATADEPGKKLALTPPLKAVWFVERRDGRQYVNHPQRRADAATADEVVKRLRAWAAGQSESTLQALAAVKAQPAATRKPPLWQAAQAALAAAGRERTVAGNGWPVYIRRLAAIYTVFGLDVGIPATATETDKDKEALLAELAQHPQIKKDYEDGLPERGTPAYIELVDGALWLLASDREHLLAITVAADDATFAKLTDEIAGNDALKGVSLTDREAALADLLRYHRGK